MPDRGSSCCFCAQTIAIEGLDPVMLAIAGYYAWRAGGDVSQYAQCHAECLRTRLHPTFPAFALGAEILGPNDHGDTSTC